MKGRNKELDLLKGFAILLMVFDHVGWGNIVHTYIQSFHMPLFFVVSGYLWNNEYSVAEVAKKRAKSVMIPYASFATFYMLLLCLSVNAGAINQSIEKAVRAVLLYPTDMANMPFAPALWFLPCFWLCNIVYAVIGKALAKAKWALIVLAAVVGMAYSSLSDIMLPLCIEPLAVALLFMFIGEKIKEYEKSIFTLLNDWRIVVLLLSIEVVLALINGSCDMRSARYHNCLLYIINAVSGTLAYWGVSRKIVESLPPKVGGGVLYLSVNSIAFLCMNQFFIMLCKQVLSKVLSEGVVWHIASNLITLLITILACAGINEVLKRCPIHLALGR